MLIKKKTFYFEIIVGPTHIYKKHYRGTLCALNLVSFNGNILHNHSVISQPGNWHWYNPQTFQISPVCNHWFVCILNAMQFCDSCDHYHSSITMCKFVFILYFIIAWLLHIICGSLMLQAPVLMMHIIFITSFYSLCHYLNSDLSHVLDGIASSLSFNYHEFKDLLHFVYQVIGLTDKNLWMNKCTMLEPNLCLIKKKFFLKLGSHFFSV